MAKTPERRDVTNTGESDLPGALMFVNPDDVDQRWRVVLRDLNLARFWAKVDVRESEDECWLWRAGAFLGSGYGAFWINGLNQNVGAHRIAALLAYGFPTHPFVLHSCDEPLCCNPRHLRYGTGKDNAKDRDARQRSPRGVAHRNSKLNPISIANARTRRAQGVTLSALALEAGVARSTLRAAVEGRTWKDAA